MITGIIHAHLQLLILKWLWDFLLIHHISSPLGWPCLSDNCFFFQQLSWHLLSAAQKAELRKRGLCGIHPHLDGKGGCVMDKGDMWVSITGSSWANSKKQLCLVIPCIPVCHYLEQSLWDQGILVPSELALVCVIKASLLFAATHHLTGCTSLAVMPHWPLSLFGYSNCPVTFFSQGLFSPLLPHLNFFFLSFKPLLPGLQFSETVNNFLHFCCSFDIRLWSCSPWAISLTELWIWLSQPVHLLCSLIYMSLSSFVFIFFWSLAARSREHHGFRWLLFVLTYMHFPQLAVFSYPEGLFLFILVYFMKLSLSSPNLILQMKIYEITLHFAAKVAAESNKTKEDNWL